MQSKGQEYINHGLDADQGRTLSKHAYLGEDETPPVAQAG